MFKKLLAALLISLCISPLAKAFDIGIEYGYGPTTNPANASYYAAMGATDVKFTDVMWKDIEPTAPWFSGLFHFYNFDNLDYAVRSWQALGMNIHMVLRCNAPWATQATVTAPPQFALLIGGADSPPKSAIHMKYWRDWVKQVVERYDGDGYNDMPGLRYPISYWEIGSEVQMYNFWMGTQEDYVAILQAAKQASKDADPNYKIILAGINFRDMYDDSPSADLVQTRLNGLPTGWKEATIRAVNFTQYTLNFPSAFDVIELHTLNDYTGMAPQLTQLTSWTASATRTPNSAGAYTKPVWAGDTMSAVATEFTSSLNWNPPLPNQFYSFPDPLFGELQTLRYALQTPTDANYLQATNWMRTEQSRLSIKRFCIGFWLGFPKVMLGTLEDWPNFSGFPYQGLVNSDFSPRPAYRAVAQFTSRVTGRTISKLTTSNTGAYAFLFAKTGSTPVVVAWKDTYRPAPRSRWYLSYPRGTETTTRVTIPFSAATAIVTPIVSVETPSPTSTIVPVISGQVTVDLGSSPIFIEAPSS